MNEEGEPRMANKSGDNEGIYRGYPDNSGRVVDAKVYGPVLLAGAILFVVPEPTTTALGIVLMAVGGFVGVIDLLSA